MSSSCSLSVSSVLALALLLSGCGSGSSSGAGGSGSTQGTASLTTTSLTFAGAPGAPTAAQTVTLSNTGSSALSISSITVTGSNATNFAETTTCGTTLGAGASCAISATFTSGSSASYAATITVTDNSGGGGIVTQSITLTGTNATPTASLTASALTFTGANGVATAAQTVTLSNTGGAALSISSIAVGGTNASNFAQTNTCGTSLAAGGSCVISVTFTAGSASTYAGAVTVTDNSNSGTTQTIALTGTATAPVAKFSANTIAFSNTLTGVTTAAQMVTLTNSGNATLSITGIVLGGTNPADFAETNNCGATLAPNAFCTISATFTPAAATSYSATVAITDNATGSPQSISLTGLGTASAANLSSSSITFANTAVGVTTAVQTVTLTNNGSATLNIASIVLGGTNPTDFSETNNCGATLTAGAFCTISATFTPAAASSYSATVTITDDAKVSPQVVALTGAGTSSAVTHTLYVFPEADNSVTPLYTLVNNAKSTIDMTMYELQDTVFSGDLVAACARGVKVRVVLDASLVKSNNTPAYNQLNTAGANCSANFSNTAFQATHQKTITIDGTTTAIMSLNLQTQYYSTTRDFALVENDAADIAAIEATFSADYAAGTPYGGTQGTSDLTYTPGAGDDLIWSPTTAQAAMLGIINSATTTLIVENEEMGASNIVSALESACTRGVTVHIAMVESSTSAPYSSYSTQFTALQAAGCSVHVYADTATGLYIHAKAVVADYGLSTQNVYMGSINYSSASMTQNRELGMYISDAASVQAIYSTMTADFAGGFTYVTK